MSKGKAAVFEFEAVKEEYRRKDARGIPMSVRERYEKALSEIRHRIRAESLSEVGKRLGEILVESGTLNQESVEQGLAEQRRRGNRELLGEILISLNLINKEELLSALRRQTGQTEV